jgi:hypothetical protein
MKRCQDCNFKHEGLLDNCWQCGSRNLFWENSPQSAQPTQAFNYYRSETPTVFAGQFNQNYNTNGYNYAGTNNFQTQTASSGGRKIFIGIAAVFTFLLLFTGVGAATYFKFRARVTPNNFTPTKVEEVKETEVVKTEEKKEEKKTETVSHNNSSRSTKLSGSSTVSTKTNTRKKTTESAELERMWVDYNVKEDGRLGMRIHVSFKTYNMKNMRSYLGIYFEKRDGTPLKTKNKKFASTTGQVAIYEFLTPGYDTAIYEDIELFMPYDELNLGRGKFNLTMSVEVIYEKGGSIDHLKDYDFIYEEK